MTINLTEAARKLIAKEGTDATFGARPLRRAIQRLLEDPLSEEILEGMWTSGSVIDVDAVDGELVFSAGSGSIPAPRKRDSIAREAELLLNELRFGPCRCDRWWLDVRWSRRLGIRAFARAVREGGPRRFQGMIGIAYGSPSRQTRFVVY